MKLPYLIDPRGADTDPPTDKEKAKEKNKGTIHGMSIIDVPKAAVTDAINSAIKEADAWIFGIAAGRDIIQADNPGAHQDAFKKAQFGGTATVETLFDDYLPYGDDVIVISVTHYYNEDRVTFVRETGIEEASSIETERMSTVGTTTKIYGKVKGTVGPEVKVKLSDKIDATVGAKVEAETGVERTYSNKTTTGTKDFNSLKMRDLKKYIYKSYGVIFAKVNVSNTIVEKVIEHRKVTIYSNSQMTEGSNPMSPDE